MNDENLSFNSNLPKGFDDKPIGNKMKFDIPEYAENQNPAMIPEANAPQKLPLIKRLQSNALKTKKEALEELLLLVKENIGEFKQYEELTLDLISYAHASVVDRILKIVLLYIQGGQQLSIDPKLVIKCIFEKCLATDKAEKQEIKKSSEEVLFWYMDNKFEEVLLNELNDALVNKNPKIIATSLHFITNLVNQYGIKRMKNLERFSKNLDFLSLPPKPIAKQQSIDFFKEAYRWMGDNVLRDFKIHPEIKDEIARFGKQYEKVPMEIKRGIKKEGNKENKVIYRMDAQQSDNQEEVDVLSSYTSKWVDETLEIAKWKDKKTVLEQFIKKTRVNNIVAPKDVSHFITLIKRLLSENNINLLLCGFQITQNLSKGLKRQFYVIAKNISTYIFMKLKDAKPFIVEAAQVTLKSMMHSVNLDDILEEVKISLDDKAPQMRLQVLKFLQNFTGKRDTRIMNILKGLIEKFASMTDDATATVRKQALDLLCNLKKTHGTKFFGDKLKKLDPKKMTAIQNAKPSEGEEMMEIQPNIQTNRSVSIKTQQPKIVQIEQRKLSKEPSLDKEGSRSNASFPMKQDEPSVQSNPLPKSMKTVTSKTLNDLTSSNQSIRYNAYQQILAKTSYQDLKPLMYTIKSNGIRESSPNNLKLGIQFVKKYAGIDPIDLQTLEYVYKHDWKKAKLTLNDFISTSKFTPEANDYIRHNNLALSNSKINNSTPANAIQQTNLKSFMKQLEFLLTKMTSPVPEMRLESAIHAIRFLQPLPIIASQGDLLPSNGFNQQCINKFCGMFRYRLGDSEEIAVKYSQLVKLMIHKGIVTRNKGLKIILNIIYPKMSENKPFITQIFDEIAATSPQFLFGSILNEIIREQTPLTLVEPLIEFIIENNELFIRNAEHKVFICPFLKLIFARDMRSNLKTGLQKILDQMVELNGEGLLQIEIKRIKINNPSFEQYVAKYNLSMSHQSSGPKNINVKSDRHKMDQDNPWPIYAGPTHILKLINQLVSLKEPLSTLAIPIGLSDSNELIVDLDNSFLADYSDLLLKWVYWRTVIDPTENMPNIIKFTYNIVMAVRDYLVQTELTVLLSSMINIMERFKAEHTALVSDLLMGIFEATTEQKEKSLLFWINLLINQQNMKKLPVNEILKLLTTCYSTDSLTQHLPKLARSPEVLKNQTFLRFLSSNFDRQFLTASGFRVLNFQQSKPIAELKPLLSDIGGPENTINITSEQKIFYVNLFLRDSASLHSQIQKINSQADYSILIDAHLKILYSVIVPFMKKEIPIVNIFTYLKELGSLFFNSPNLKISHCLKDLSRILLFFLIDLDQNTIDNKEEISKSVNKIILFILEKAESKHMLEVLMLLLDSQLKINLTSHTKVQHLFYKCIGKVCKFPKFQQKWQDNLTFIIFETNSLFNRYDLKYDHPLIRTIKGIWKNDIISNSTFFNFIENYINGHAMNITFLQVFNEVINTENISKEEVREKDNREIIKAITPSLVNKIMNLKKNEAS